MQGSLFENYIVMEILKNELHTGKHADLYYFRDSNGNEVDLIIDRKNSREFIEIKSSHTFRPEMIQPMIRLKRNNEQGFLLYKGKERGYSADIKIMNYKSYFKNNDE